MTLKDIQRMERDALMHQYSVLDEVVAATAAQHGITAGLALRFLTAEALLCKVDIEKRIYQMPRDYEDRSQAKPKRLTRGERGER
jgi:hypothetical protein